MDDAFQCVQLQLSYRIVMEMSKGKYRGKCGRGGKSAAIVDQQIEGSKIYFQLRTAIIFK